MRYDTQLVDPLRSSPVSGSAQSPSVAGVDVAAGDAPVVFAALSSDSIPARGLHDDDLRRQVRSLRTRARLVDFSPGSTCRRRPSGALRRPPSFETSIPTNIGFSLAHPMQPYGLAVPRQLFVV